jgi:hypothetical protein
MVIKAGIEMWIRYGGSGGKGARDGKRKQSEVGLEDGMKSWFP